MGCASCVCAAAGCWGWLCGEDGHPPGCRGDFFLGGHRLCRGCVRGGEKLRAAAWARGEPELGEASRGVRSEEPWPWGAGGGGAAGPCTAPQPRRWGLWPACKARARRVCATRAVCGSLHGCTRMHRAHAASPAPRVRARCRPGQVSAHVCTHAHTRASACLHSRACLHPEGGGRHARTPPVPARGRPLTSRRGCTRGRRSGAAHTHTPGVALARSRARSSPRRALHAGPASPRCLPGVTHGAQRKP